MFSDYTLMKTFEARGAPVQKRYKSDCIRAGGARNFSLSVSREAKLGYIDKAERQNTFLSAKKGGGGLKDTLAPPLLKVGGL